MEQDSNMFQGHRSHDSEMTIPIENKPPKWFIDHQSTGPTGQPEIYMKTLYLEDSNIKDLERRVSKDEKKDENQLGIIRKNSRRTENSVPLLLGLTMRTSNPVFVKSISHSRTNHSSKAKLPTHYSGNAHQRE